MLYENESDQLKRLSNCLTHSNAGCKIVLELKGIIILEVNTAIFIYHIKSCSAAAAGSQFLDWPECLVMRGTSHWWTINFVAARVQDTVGGDRIISIVTITNAIISHTALVTVTYYVRTAVGTTPYYQICNDDHVYALFSYRLIASGGHRFMGDALPPVSGPGSAGPLNSSQAIKPTAGIGAVEQSVLSESEEARAEIIPTPQNIRAAGGWRGFGQTMYYEHVEGGG